MPLPREAGSIRLSLRTPELPCRVRGRCTPRGSDRPAPAPPTRSRQWLCRCRATSTATGNRHSLDRLHLAQVGGDRLSTVSPGESPKTRRSMERCCHTDVRWICGSTQTCYNPRRNEDPFHGVNAAHLSGGRLLSIPRITRPYAGLWKRGFIVQPRVRPVHSRWTKPAPDAQSKGEGE